MDTEASVPVRIVAGLTLFTALLWAGAATATITQGDLSLYGNLRSQESGRWGEGGAREHPQATVAGQVAATESGGSFDFAHWDLVQMRQTADIRGDYRLVKEYKLLGRVDTILIKEADFYANYRGWYDAFPDLKPHGRAEPNREWGLDNYTQRAKTEGYRRDDLREFYLQADITSALSFRIGRQQLIWTEADALSGSEIINPADLRFHWTHFESPEDMRRGVEMVKMNYQLPDFLGTSNNLWDLFWIPAENQAGTMLLNTTDPRAPYIVYAGAKSVLYDLRGLPFRDNSLADGARFPLFNLPAGTLVNTLVGSTVVPASTAPLFFDLNVLIHNRSSKSIQNSEFGMRYSWLLPIGNGLQMSFIYLYVARFGKLQFDPSNNPSAPFYLGSRGANAVQLTPGIWYVPTQSWPNIPGGIPYLGPGGSLASSLPLLLANGVTSPARLGTLAALVDSYTPRSNSFHVTGTYYDKDLTDMVFRYDFSYRPRVAFFRANPMNSLAQTLQQSLQGTHPKGSLWKEEALFLLGCDRPTYIPWISKQHTFLVLQNTLNYFPDRPKGAGGLGVGGRIREIQDLVFFAAVNWMMDGRWAATNVAVWDIDDNVGELISTNSFRYSRNVLLGVNVQWYLGRSGRSTDPFLFSHDQRINELELRATYEI